jgi:hypothetical protein
VDVKRAVVRGGQLHERVFIAALRGAQQPIGRLDHASAGTGHGPPSSVHGDARPPRCRSHAHDRGTQRFVIRL